MEKIELTEEELQAKIDEAVKTKVAEKEAELKKQHDSDMAQMRISAKDAQEKAVKKAVEEANLSTEEKAKKESEEKFAELERENAELKAYKHQTVVTDALAKEKLPVFLKNDSRLVGAKTEEELANAIKSVKEDYEGSLPKGSIINTNVGGGNGQTQPKGEFDEMRSLGLQKGK